MVEAESEGEEGEDEGIGEETGVYYSDKNDATICRYFPVLVILAFWANIMSSYK